MGISINADGRASFHGVGSCGDVWCCPVCALRIAEGRRQEVAEAMRQHRAAGGIVVLATFTFSHSNTERLADNVAGLCRALRRLKQTRQYKALMSEIGYRGQIRALEVMHGSANGWHPHVHEIWFLDRGDLAGYVIEQLEGELFLLWQAACVREGLGAPDREHGLKIEYRKPGAGDGSAVGAYVAKWGHELTHLQAKAGKLGSRSPWAILRDLVERWNYRDSNLYREYAKAIKGRAQLFWSRGLKKHFHIDEASDDEVADAPEKRPVCDLGHDQWQAILYFDAHCWVLEIAEAKPLFLPDLLERLVDLRERRRRTQMLKRKEQRDKILKYMQQQFPEMNFV